MGLHRLGCWCTGLGLLGMRAEPHAEQRCMPHNMQTTEPQRQTIKGPTTHFPRTYLDEIMEDGHSGYTHPDSEELERLMTGRRHIYIAPVMLIMSS